MVTFQKKLICLTPEQIRRLEKVANRLTLPQSAVIRLALEKYLRELETQEVVA